MNDQHGAEEIPVLDEVNAAEGYSFGALLERFFLNSPLGKELTQAQISKQEGKGQDLFVGSSSYSSKRSTRL